MLSEVQTMYWPFQKKRKEKETTHWHWKSLKSNYLVGNVWSFGGSCYNWCFFIVLCFLLGAILLICFHWSVFGSMAHHLRILDLVLQYLYMWTFWCRCTGFRFFNFAVFVVCSANCNAYLGSLQSMVLTVCIFRRMILFLRYNTLDEIWTSTKIIT